MCGWPHHPRTRRGAHQLTDTSSHKSHARPANPRRVEVPDTHRTRAIRRLDTGEDLSLLRLELFFGEHTGVSQLAELLELIELFQVVQPGEDLSLLRLELFLGEDTSVSELGELVEPCQGVRPRCLRRLLRSRLRARVCRCATRGLSLHTYQLVRQELVVVKPAKRGSEQADPKIDHADHDDRDEICEKSREVLSRRLLALDRREQPPQSLVHESAAESDEGPAVRMLAEVVRGVPPDEER